MSNWIESRTRHGHEPVCKKRGSFVPRRFFERNKIDVTGALIFPRQELNRLAAAYLFARRANPTQRYSAASQGSLPHHEVVVEHRTRQPLPTRLPRSAGTIASSRTTSCHQPWHAFFGLPLQWGNHNKTRCGGQAARMSSFNEAPASGCGRKGVPCLRTSVSPSC